MNSEGVKILVTGGAGYIGSHACKALAQQNFIPVTLDNLVTGHKNTVRWGPFYQGDIRDRGLLDKIFKQENIAAVMHFAAHINVGESVQNPLKYYDNNIIGSINLISAMLDHRIYNLIFSSSCTVYGNSGRDWIDETCPLAPINPYGETKMATEALINALQKSHPLKSVILRYFNAGGAALDGELGETRSPETHLIPLAINAGLDPGAMLKVFGKTYPTPDGSCIRDYVHVEDVADAHVAALNLILKQNYSPSVEFVNLGSGKGYSVLEIIREVEKNIGQQVNHTIGDRREGDPARLVADAGKAAKFLAWKPRHSDLNTIIQTAYKWHLKSNH